MMFNQEVRLGISVFWLLLKVALLVLLLRGEAATFVYQNF